MNKYIIITILIAASIITTSITSFLSYRNAERAADDFLKAQALGIATSLDTALAKYGTKSNLFAQINKAGQWEGMAFLALYGKGGVIVMHSNSNLVGKRTEDADVGRVLRDGKTRFAYKTLGTGEKVFVIDTALHFGQAVNILRVALHTYPSRKIVREARLQLWSTVGIISVLCLVTVFFLASMKKREDLEKTLLEKEKLAAIGEIAAVLAHEIRNPLGSIKGFAQYISETHRKRESPPEEAAYIEVIVKEAGRLEKLTEDLLSYARSDSLQLQPFSPSDLLAEVLSSITLPSSVTLHNMVTCTDIITSDREKLRHIVTNIIRNAADAISGAGSVTLTCGKTEDGLFLRIEDTGAGMAGMTMKNIFRPFFTTKAKGTGLGLAIADRYTRALGGKIIVESAEGKGSVFTILIPSLTCRKPGI